MINADFGNLLQHGLGCFGVPVDPRLALDKHLGTATLDHVAEEGPGGTTETDERHTALQLLACHRNGLVDVAELLGYINVSGKDASVLAVIWGFQGLGE